MAMGGVELGLDLERLKGAAEEAAWLCARGYDAGAVASFVGQQRMLGDRERRLLDASARLDAHHRHHIARELDPEDVERRPLRLEIASVVSTVAAAIRRQAGKDALLLESAAGLVCDPEPADIDADLEREALSRIAKAIVSLRPSAVRIVCSEGRSNLCDATERAVTAARKLKIERDLVANVAARLKGTANVVSADPAALDECGTWFNLAGMIVREMGVPTLRLG
jgi:hypothetical protein